MTIEWQIGIHERGSGHSPIQAHAWKGRVRPLKTAHNFFSFMWPCIVTNFFIIKPDRCTCFPYCDRLQRPNYLSRVDHVRKIRSRRQRTDIGKYSFVNRTIRLWNRLPAEVLETLPCKPNAFRKRVRKVINVVNWRKLNVLRLSKSVVKWSEVKGRAVKGGKSGRMVRGSCGYYYC
jgi:hypothetical protein